MVRGDAASTSSTNFVTVALECTVPVGLFGLQKNTSPAPVAAAVIAGTSSFRSPSTWMSFTGTLIARAFCAGFSQVGSGATRWRVEVVNASTAASMTSVEPVPIRTFCGSTPRCFAIAA